MITPSESFHVSVTCVGGWVEGGEEAAINLKIEGHERTNNDCVTGGGGGLR